MTEHAAESNAQGVDHMEQNLKAGEECYSGVLNSVYGGDNVKSLLHWLLDQRCSVHGLLRDADHASYRDLLCNALVVQSADAPPIPAPEDITAMSLPQRRKHLLALVLGIIGRAMQSDERSTVLALGYRKIRPGASAGMEGLPFVENVETNTIVSHVTSFPFQELLGRIGSPLIQHLLTHCSIFAAIDNACFLQLSGRPLPLVLQGLRRQKDHAAGVRYVHNIAMRRSQDAGSQLAMSQAMTQAIDAEHASQDEKDMAPSSVAKPQGSQAPSPYMERIARSRIFYSSESRGQDFQSTQTWAGLPRMHLLHRLNDSKSGARELVSHMFGSRGSIGTSAPLLAQPTQLRRAAPALGQRALSSSIPPIASMGELERADSSPACQPPQLRLSKRLQRMIPLCHSIIQRHQRCPYGQLLDRYCPWPLEAVDAHLKRESKLDGEAQIRHEQDRSRAAHSGSSSSVTPHSGFHSMQTLSVGSMLDDGVEHSNLDGESVREAPSLDADTIHCSHEEVACFVRKVCAAVFPSELFGSTHNWRIFCSNVNRFVALRRHESVNVQQLVQGFKVSHCNWLRRTESHLVRVKRRKLATATERRVSTAECGVDVSPAGDGVRPAAAKKRKVEDCHNSEQTMGSQESQAQSLLVARMLRWLMESFIVSLLRNCFFCTDSEPHRNRVLYYRRDVWRVIERDALRTLSAAPSFLPAEACGSTAPTTGYRSAPLPPNGAVFASRSGDIGSKFQYEPVPTEQVETRFGLSDSKLGYAHLRLKPKAQGVRPIVNMARGGQWTPPGSPDVVARFPSINSVMRAGFEVLKFERQRCSVVRTAGSAAEKRVFHVEEGHPIVGASVFGYEEIFTRIVRFAKANSLPGATGSLRRRVYAVTVDVRKAFDCILRDKLLEILDEVFVDQGYHIQKYSKTFAKLGQIRSTYCRRVFSASDIEAFPSVAAAEAASTHDAVFTDGVLRSFINREDLLELLHVHIQRNLVKLNDQFYLQVRGIPQGSVFSALLCCMYLAHVERSCLWPALRRSASPSEWAQGDRLLLRHMDDFLFLSTSAAEASAFVKLMHSGFPEYGVVANPKKTKTTADMPCGGCISWNGLVLSTDSLSVYADYSRYVHGGPLANSLTVETSRGSPGEALRRALKRSLAPKCHPLLLHSLLNDARTVAINVYEIFLIAGMKFVCYMKELKKQSTTHKKVTKGDAPSQLSNEKFAYSVLEEGFSYFHSVVSTRFLHLPAEVHHPQGQGFPLSKHHVEYLGASAFLAIFSLKQTSYPKVIGKLKALLTKTANDLQQSQEATQAGEQGGQPRMLRLPQDMEVILRHSRDVKLDQIDF